MFQGLEGKTVLVTGAASGIGAAFVRGALEAGARIAALDRNQAVLTKFLNELEADSVIGLAVDVSDSTAVKGAVEQTVSRFGRLDGCFSNAGIAPPFIELPDIPDDLFDRTVRVNQYGTFYVVKHAMAVMRQQQCGAIVCTSSTSGIRGVPAYAHYCASKHAVIGIVRVAAVDGAKYNIRANAICPGMTDTPINDPVHRDWNPSDPAQAMRDVAARIPLKRYGTAREVADAAAYLLETRVPTSRAKC
jgi:NAD(P)-dependent dehydrogenase (short-subunit alcohol dehydrogenase family)